MGSGFRLKQAIKMFGKDQFVKEILFVFDSSEKMFDKEREIVNEQFLSRPDTYNMVLGGNGGPNKGIIGQKRMFNPTTGKRIVVYRSAVDKMLQEGFELRSGWSVHQGRKYMHHDGKVISVDPADVDRLKEQGWKTGMPVSPTSGQTWIYSPNENRYSLCYADDINTYLTNGWIKKKWSPIKKGTSCWINDGETNKRIQLANLSEYIVQGWKRGAIQKHSTRP
jgi:hypothetical protein